MASKTFLRALDARSAAAIARNPVATPDQLTSAAGASEAVDRLLAKHPSARADLLGKLARSSDKTTRKNVAVHPNASKEVLLSLATQFPGSFFKNPAFDWLLLEDPDVLTSLGHQVLARILKRPDCPVSFLNWAASHGNEQEQLAVAMNPRAPDGVLRQLAALLGKPGEAARGHRLLQVDVPEADLSHEFDRVIKASLGELEGNGAKFAWKKGSIGPAHWPWLGLRVRLEVLGPWPAYVETSESAQGRDCLGLVHGCIPRHVRALAQHPDGYVSRLVARCVITPPEVLQDLADGNAMNYVASNPATPAAVLERLASDEDPDTRLYIAQNPSTPTGVRVALLAALAKDESSYARQSVAQHRGTPMVVLEILARDEDSGVRQAVAENAATPVALLARLATDEESDVRVAVAEHPRTLAATLERLAGDEDSEVRRAVAFNNCTNATLLERLAKDERPDVRAGVALHPATPAATLEWLSLEGGCSEEVAANPAAPASILERLAKHKWDGTRRCVARNPATPTKVLVALSKDADERVRWSAKRALLATSPRKVAELAKRTEQERAKALVGDPDASLADKDAAYRSIIDAGDLVDLGKLLEDPACPVPLAQWAAARRWWIALVAFARRLPGDKRHVLPSVSEDQSLVAVHQQECEHLLLDPQASILARLIGADRSSDLAIADELAVAAARSSFRAVRLLGLSHPKAEPALLIKRYRSTDWAERLAVARNPSTPSRVIAELEKDAHHLVAMQAGVTGRAKATASIQ